MDKLDDKPNCGRRAMIFPTFGFVAWTLLIATLSSSARADVPDRPPGELFGIYKIASSSDPAFAVKTGEQWFFDFGEGICGGRLNGSVAISLRRNPSVRVDIRVWQYFPKEGSLLIGSPYHEGSKNAVALGNWQVQAVSGGLVLERGKQQILLNRPSPGEY